VTDEGHSTIGVLASNILLEIFYFYQEFYRINPTFTNPRHRGPAMPLSEWCPLMHVCRRWRQIIFESPRRLGLQILCTQRNRFKKSLGIWPDFPIAIDDNRSRTVFTGRIEEDDVIAALEHPNRVCRIVLESLLLELMATMSCKPYPLLKCLDICPRYEIDLPDGFLGGSAPCLEKLSLSHISFPGLPTLLSSTKSLVRLTLWNVPPTGYISPDVMVTCLAELPRLTDLRLSFKPATVDLHLGQIHPPPLTRTVLPALTHFFGPTSKYLEDLVAQIDCPELAKVHVFYADPAAPQVAQFFNFVNRSVGPEISPFTATKIHISCGDTVRIDTYRPPNHLKGEDWDPAKITISYRVTDRQVYHISQVLNRFSAILSTVAYLSLVSEYFDFRLMASNNLKWLHLLHPFSAVQTLRVSRELAGHLTLALEDIPAERANEVLPSLRLIYLEPHWQSLSLEKFVAARGLSDRPVTVVKDEKEFDEILQSFVL
jgi:hypothetical protein